MDGDESNQISANVFEWTKQGNVVALEKHTRYLDIRDNIGASPMHYAASMGHFRIIRLIVQITGQQELSARDEEGNTPLHWAVQKDQPGSCSVLLTLGADPNILNNSQQSPLHMAVSMGKNFVLEQLVSHKQTDVNLEGDLGNTPVILAASLDNHEALVILYKHGAKFCRQNKLGHFAIHAAAFAGAKKSLEVILLKGEEVGLSIDTHINYVDKSCSSPLHLAVRGGNLDIIKLCIAYGAKIEQQQCDKSTALHFACSQGAIEVVKVMLTAYHKVCDLINITDGANQTPLHKAAIFDHFELSEYLISQGADIDFVDCKGHSPLLLATSCGAWRTVSLLLSHGADLKKKDKSGCNFLHLAILQPRGLKNLPTEVLQHESVRELLNDEDTEGCTPLHYACRLGIPESVKNMLGLEVSLDQKSKQKKSALHFAAEAGHVAAVRLLLYRGAKIILNKNDASFLHEAVHNGRKEVTNTVIESDRCEEVMTTYKPNSSKRCIVMDMIEFLPDSFKAMVNFNRVSLLTHPVCKKYLEMKWNAYGVKAHLLNMTVYALGVFPLTFERIGIYVVMFREISRTLLSIILLFFYLILGFALAFYALMIEQQHFGRMFLSLLQTFVMMVGEINYQENFLKPFLQGDLPFPLLTLAIFVWFVLLVPILLMNLLIGLAVGDIAEVQTNACLKRIAMQIELHTNLEERLPYWFMKRVDQVTIKEFPNRCFNGKKRWVFCWNEVRKSRTRLSPTIYQLTPLERELTKQKYRMKEMSESMEKQHNLLKLIVQKMEISSEAEEHDGPPVFQELKEKLLSRSKWGPLLRAVTARKKGVCKFMKTS
ncbi:hypothetical protein cypCar_00019551 [Cyprinus carpio]|nr:hypothetical protein cypCar_00019551 [Cyprinus carpio]